MLPFIRDPKTDQIRHPKRAMENVPQSTAVTAVSNYNKFMVKPKNSTTNYMGYTKMYAPCNTITTIIELQSEGYLDMNKQKTLVTPSIQEHDIKIIL